LTIPFLIGTLRELLGIQKILQVATFLSLVPFIIYVVLRFPKAKQAQGFPIKEAAGIVRSPLLWLTAFILFFQSGNEFTVGGWISTYLEKTFGFGGSAAALALAAYWAAIISGRLLTSRLVRTIRGETLILGSAALALCAAALMALAPSGNVAAAGAVVIGLGFAAIYPTTLAIVGEKFAAVTGTAFSVVIAVGLVGGMLAPWLAGRIAEASSLRQGLIIPVINCAMIVVLSVLAGREIKKEKQERNPV